MKYDRYIVPPLTEVYDKFKTKHALRSYWPFYIDNSLKTELGATGMLVVSVPLRYRESKIKDLDKLDKISEAKYQFLKECDFSPTVLDDEP